MKAFALRDKVTGLYLPHGKRGRMNSYREFTAKNDPRLFSRRSAASNTLNAWKAGKWGWRGCGEDVDLEPRSVPGRRSQEIEIVEFELIEKG